MNPFRLTATTTVFALLAALTFDAAAASVRVTCEVRPGRSKASVDGRALAAGTYTTQIVSGGNVATSPAQTAVSGEIETDYASNPGDIAGGATPIAPTFITGGQLTGKVVDAAGNTVASDTVACRVRNR